VNAVILVWNFPSYAVIVNAWLRISNACAAIHFGCDGKNAVYLGNPAHAGRRKSIADGIAAGKFAFCLDQRSLTLITFGFTETLSTGATANSSVLYISYVAEDRIWR
jgi:hypothetical protein